MNTDIFTNDKYRLYILGFVVVAVLAIMIYGIVHSTERFGHAPPPKAKNPASIFQTLMSHR